MPLQTLVKQSYEERIFTIDFSSKMASNATISSVVSLQSANLAFVTGSSNLTIAAITPAGQTVQALYQGGTSGELYQITCKILDSNSQRLEFDGLLKVQDE
jgi:hypothetical protein